jgi:hypothetical protein
MHQALTRHTPRNCGARRTFTGGNHRMSQRIAMAAVIGLGGFLAASAPGVVTPVVASTVTDVLASPITDISAQRKEERQEQRQEQRREQRQEQRREESPKAGGRPEQRPGAQRPEERRPGAQRPEERRPGAQRPEEPRPGAQRPAAGPGRVVIEPRGGPRISGRVRGGGPIVLGGRSVVLVRGPHVVQWRGRQRNLVPIAALAALSLGGIAYAANAYVPVEQPVCSGYTEGGCFFHWTEALTPEGDLIPQCVAYCPQ